MGAPKQKWTQEEEAALRAGVEKYGPGKWRAIQKDSTLGPCLASRSNVDLKDKWRNISASVNGTGSRSSKSVASPAGPGMMKLMEEAVSVTPLAMEAPDFLEDVAPLTITNGTELSHNAVDKRSLGSNYDALVLEAVLTLKDPAGSSNSAIASYIEEHHAVPSNFRRLLGSKLKTLISQGKLMKVLQNYKIPETETPSGESSPKIVRSQRVEQEEAERLPSIYNDTAKKSRTDLGLKKPKVDGELAILRLRTADEAARAAAQAVAEAEAAAAEAEQAARVSEAAEAAAEAAEAAAEAAALALRPSRSSRAVQSQEPILVPV
ncbi:hypothetical protein O6H91_04G069200 [Diphasiastrum complanatum]|uniref:Uncharacterized protein n=3 Tax=Diphasiastrum complanatum TaxID=34168 RepID=A0ACC2DXV9_DIPCM|nr:hypothetical protein O6H91_04G069200 [Diphasiastrum complanatum]KAJ7559080.1 hypothetical protein O6H91_04G069200 [Diphasiastrum complanatum]KAJ7559081.1 hypothetical protein O6H91_04G069200 [Diphasiastrum complanatum]